MPMRPKSLRALKALRAVNRCVWLSLVAAWTLGCASTLSISQVLQRGAYADRLRGLLTGEGGGPSTEAPDGSHWYELDDGTGRILVQTRQAPPQPCLNLRVE